jgi:hypothetical protein
MAKKYYGVCSLKCRGQELAAYVEKKGDWISDVSHDHMMEKLVPVTCHLFPWDI